MKCYSYHRKKIVLIFAVSILLLTGLMGRLAWLMLAQSEIYATKAKQLHERERKIKAARGEIIDATGTVLAANKAVCTVSVIHSQLKEPEKVIEVLTRELKLPEETVRKKVEKISSMERIQSNVEKAAGDRIRECNLAGVKVDEDYCRTYPFGSLASKVIGFTGGDNQGIIGLEVKYDDILQGEAGQILTLTDARGVELSDSGERREESVPGRNLRISLDHNIQLYAQQAAAKVLEKKQAERVSMILMNPQNGEIYAMVDLPEFDLNDPYTVLDGLHPETQEEQQNLLNQIWRNGCISDTYEPGSTFKVITAAAGLESKVVTISDTFSCPGYKIVEDRRIRCHKTAGHGAQTFVQAVQNSCNPVFIEVGLRMGAKTFYQYFEQFGLLSLTGIDLPGEASTIMHKEKNIGEVELATVSFGQSFQISPLQLLTTVSSIVNGGIRVTPHFGVMIEDSDGKLETIPWDNSKQILSKETSKTMQYLLEQVVDGGSGKNAYIEGFHIGGKTATSETLPRGTGRYISSFVGFAPADHPIVAALCVIHNPQGVYYGGTVAAPVVREVFETVLPYLGIEQEQISTETCILSEKDVY